MAVARPIPLDAPVTSAQFNVAGANASITNALALKGQPDVPV
jgi:hypothetical protein